MRWLLPKVPNIICPKEPLFQKNLDIISKKEAAGHEWLQMWEHSEDIESIGASCSLGSVIACCQEFFFLI